MARTKTPESSQPSQRAGTPLPPYDDENVLSASVSISNTGDGLSEAMSIDPVLLKVRDKVTIVLECEVTEHRHKAVPKIKEGLVLVLRMKAGRATIIDNDIVAEYLDDQALRIEQAKGIQRMPFGEDGWSDGQRALAEAHKTGDHADGLRAGCPLCQMEEDAARDEQPK